ncbi:ABCB family ABC transporter ATP-binding protein/permease [Halopseudomonas bauzanensis]|uniref:ABC transporter ATP-binding protein/permease n=1 Tax=Halopseudomonas bauzanensis TaxID=653930 RepID=A0A1I4N9M7_9GAMM|nr:ABC transporter ATP-binding protein/permease [Halopseudomonas bauzanensis]TKA90154.1 ABC transporter ATP-binding protein/permease [Halopseudomonas bauzanensis]SES13582.1 ATP-binding cassette, subfamily B [Halopseudomonas bauzanensis]SFM12262.1 ATP-binding cassette, subfamily B [Halopseudomonas bauzanensis]
MRPSSDNSYAGGPVNWRIIRSLLPYLSEFRGRVALAMTCLLLAKLAGVAVPWMLKLIVEHYEAVTDALILVPVALLTAYGLLRFSTVFFSELRDAVFARVAERAMRRVSLKVFEHLHRLDLGFHLSRRTGGLARDIERGTSGISFLLRFMVFNILPTLLEIGLITVILLANFSPVYALTVLGAVVVYSLFTIAFTEWRNRFVRESNQLDNRSNTRAVDSLLNYETVKYFGNEPFEARQYDEHLAGWESARMKTRLSLSALNSGQALIIAGSVTLMMVLAANQVSAGSMTLGELVMINAYMIQLFVPLNFLGFIYREIREALINIERLFGLLEAPVKVADVDEAAALRVEGGTVRFEHVNHSYTAERPILKDVSFTIPAGQTLAVVGPSGAGKSTLARLLFRFYDVSSGGITIDGQDIRTVTQRSLRQAIGVVPQDTVLFNDSIGYNIAYGKPGASDEEVWAVLRMAQLEDFVQRLPEGLQTQVGERGLKLSGGEKQRIAIARVLLKDPQLLILDEATSSLDTHSERRILDALNLVSRRRTTLAIAHRLSTITHAEQILVLDQGQVVEQGTHQQLLAAGGAYARLWAEQQREGEDTSEA